MTLQSSVLYTSILSMDLFLLYFFTKLRSLIQRFIFLNEEAIDDRLYECKRRFYVNLIHFQVKPHMYYVVF